MDPRDAMEPEQLEMLARILRSSCWPASKNARMGAKVSSQTMRRWSEAQNAWPEAERLRELALAIQVSCATG